MEEVLVDSLILQPLTVKTPIIEIEADYGNPILDGLVLVFVLGSLYIFKKMINRLRSDKAWLSAYIVMNQMIKIGSIVEIVTKEHLNQSTLPICIWWVN